MRAVVIASPGFAGARSNAQRCGVMIAALAAGGCNQVWDLRQTIAIDAAELPDAPDRDSDGVPDLIDNCPDDVNATQRDVDGDGIGDVCDNCPIIANPKQEHIGDIDAVGDACDPNPSFTGDCLLLYDGFGQPAQFPQRWQVEPASLAGSVTAGPAEITIAATASRVAVLSREVGAEVAAVQLSATKLDATMGEAGVVSSASTDLKAGYLCWIALDNGGTLSLHAEFAALGDNPEPMSSEPIDRGLVVRLGVPLAPSQPTQLQCRADYGIAVATKRIGTQLAFPTSTFAGVFASSKPVTVHAIAMYGRANPCPTPIIH